MAAEKDALKKQADELGLDVTRQDGRTDLEPTAADYQHALDVHSGALAPDPEPEPEATEETYIVSGPHEVDGHAPGEQYTATYEPGHRAFLVDGGYIKVVDDEEKEG